MVYGLARSREKFDQLNIQAECIEGSLKKEGSLDFIEKLPADLDVIYHTAGIVSTFDLKDFYDVNYHSTENLINQLKQKYPQIHFVLISSLAAAGPEAYFESDLPQPVSHYGRSKLLAEKALLSLAPEGWSKTTVRPPMVIGPGDPAVLDVFKMVKGKNILVAGLGGLENLYSFVCIYDLVNLLKNVLSTTDSDEEGDMPVFYSSHPEMIKMKELLDTIQGQLQIEKVNYIRLPIPLIKATSLLLKPLSYFMSQEIRLTPDKVSELKQKRWTCSGELSQEKLGFTYEWNLTKTVEVTLSDYKQRGWI